MNKKTGTKPTFKVRRPPQSQEQTLADAIIERLDNIITRVHRVELDIGDVKNIVDLLPAHPIEDSDLEEKLDEILDLLKSQQTKPQAKRERKTS